MGVLYFLLLGGTPIGELSDYLRVVNSIVAAVVVVIWLRWMSIDSDWVDRLALGALLLYLVAAIGSRFPRQSFEAATGALAYTAIFYVARRLCWYPEASRALSRTMSAVCSALAIAFALVWLAIWGDWLSLTKWSQWPPISIGLAITPYGNRYDVEFLVLLLIPAVMLTERGRGKWIMRSVTLIAVGVVVLLGGARTALVAIVVASLAALLPGRVGNVRRLSRRTVIIALAVPAVALLALFLAGLTGPAVGRLADLSTVALRGVLWGASVDAWLQNPIFGFGPGSFPFVLQMTSYFSHATPAPPHPDNAIAQAAAESGVIGLIAMTVLVIGAVRLLANARIARTGIWALTFFAVASLGANPSDYPFLVLPLIIWAAFAMPARPPSGPSLRMAVPTRAGMVLAVVLIGTVFATQAGARVAQSIARTALASNEPVHAIEALTAATTLDPSLALYWRELGVIRLASGHPADAVAALRRATGLNPSDTTALRALALATSSSGSISEGLAWAQVAAKTRPSESDNLVMLAYVQQMAGRGAVAAITLAEALRISPWLAAAEGWERLGVRGERAALLQRAVSQWLANDPPLDPRIESPVWLVFLASRSDLLARASAASTTISPSLAHALDLSVTCPSGKASELNVAPGISITTSAWEVQMVVEQIRGDLRDTTIRLARRIDGSTSAGAIASSALGRNAVDVAYGVVPLPDMDIAEFPRERNGRYRVLHELDAAAAEIPIQNVAACQRSSGN
jgi:tetratricopeptide (TPR) repeat protein